MYNVIPMNEDMKVTQGEPIACKITWRGHIGKFTGQIYLLTRKVFINFPTMMGSMQPTPVDI
jgi:hypothetical protein